ncbi:hypothetical protein JKG47_02490 [Acidithiobacillus sp. MC6.1]|nr:hypothetical protein [Acidithiobacillus sp. MC6.1]
MTEETAFRLRAREVAKNFLQSVVVVDDRASYDSAQPTQVQRPRRGASLSITSNSARTAPNEQRHHLNAKELIDGFAMKGMVCAVIKPEQGEIFQQAANNVSQRADVVILDWDIYGDGGESVLNTIEGIIDADSSEHDRLRLIVIYTGENDLAKISDQLEGRLQSFSEVIGLSVTRENVCVYRIGPARIVIYAKQASHLTMEFQSRAVAIDELPDAVINEFSRMTEGLLPNAVLKAIGELRRVTHRVINKFSAELDAAYLNHRALTVPSEEAQSHFYPLIADEIEAILYDSGVDDALSPDTIRSWLDHRVANGLALDRKMKINGKTNAKNAAFELIVNGIKEAKLKHPACKSFVRSLDGIDSNKASNEHSALSYLTNVLALTDGPDALDLDLTLAMIMSIRARYSKPNPTLRLGAVIKDTRNKYYLCIQALCDCVRIKKGLKFTFLVLSKSMRPSDFVVKSDNVLTRLKVLSGPKDVVRIPFGAGNIDTPVRADLSGDSWSFTDDKGQTYKWICDLRIQHAQRVANEYAAKISRVGLTESEWLRRQK